MARQGVVVGILDYKLRYRRNLPHIQPPGKVFFITARLSGSLPQAVIDQRNHERKWLDHLAKVNQKHHALVKPDFERKWFKKFESILDGSECGPTWLSDDRVAAQVAESLHYRDGKVFRLDAFSIMPNHFHVLFKPLRIENKPEDLMQPALDDVYHSLASIMKSLKGYTARRANRLLNRTGEFWAHESYDHYVRNAEEWERIEAYILNNPVKAKLIGDWREWKWSYRRKS